MHSRTIIKQNKGPKDLLHLFNVEFDGALVCYFAEDHVKGSEQVVPGIFVATQQTSEGHGAHTRRSSVEMRSRPLDFVFWGLCICIVLFLKNMFSLIYL